MPLFLFLLAPETGAATTGAAPQQLNGLQKLLGGSPIPMFVGVFAIFYFMLIRPQQKKQKEHEAWQKRVGVGDEVVTTGGLVGKITHVTDDVVTVEVGDKVRVRVMRAHVTGKSPAQMAKEKAESGKDKEKVSAST